jgi:hypothetical protein
MLHWVENRWLEFLRSTGGGTALCMEVMTK